MRFNKFDLNLLVALDTLLNEKSITKSAEKLNMSPSAMSSSLARLREYFNDDLLTQIGRKMVVTPLGEDLKINVRNALINIETSILINPIFDPKDTNRLFSILCSDYTQTILVPHLMELTAKQSSKAYFQFLAQNSSPNESLEKGEADLLIIPEIFVSDQHPSEVLFEEEYVCISWKHSNISLGEMTEEKYINAGHIAMRPSIDKKVFSDRIGLNKLNNNDYLERVIESKYGLKLNIVATTYSFTSMPSLVVGSENIATVHARLAKKLATILPIKIHKLPFDIPKMKQCIQWHEYKDKDPGLLWLRKSLLDSVKEMDKEIEYIK